MEENKMEMVNEIVEETTEVVPEVIEEVIDNTKSNKTLGAIAIGATIAGAYGVYRLVKKIRAKKNEVHEVDYVEPDNVLTPNETSEEE